MRLTSTTTARRAMTPPNARYKTFGAAKGGDARRKGHKTEGQRTGDAAGQPVAFFVAAHVREHSLMLAPQQPALKTGVLAPAVASGNAVAVFARSSSGLSSMARHCAMAAVTRRGPSSGWPWPWPWPSPASFCRSGPNNPPPPKRHQATAPPLRHHDVDAMVVTPAGPASGRKPKMRHRAGHRDTS
jgi:hypothetical protein